MRFRPCIDLHQGRVKQIVGSTLHDANLAAPQTNFSSDLPSAWYADLYRRDRLNGGHVIMLGPGNEQAAREALAAWPGGMQVGGGINATNAQLWLDAGASHVIVTSAVFHDGQLDFDQLHSISRLIGKKRLVLDLSCRWRENGYYVVTDRWQKFSTLQIDAKTLADLACWCDEFLVHAVDVEGKCMGIDHRLLTLLAQTTPLPITYAGGVSSMEDLVSILHAGLGRIDATVGSALDIFGGTGLRYEDVVTFHEQQQ